jgi:predicted Zn finger-like uncharacterized protein
MLVQCPSCRTTYKVADEVVKGAAPAFRCSRCKHTFELDGAKSLPPAVVKTAESGGEAASPPQDRELSFNFAAIPTSADVTQRQLLNQWINPLPILLLHPTNGR